MKLKGWSVCFNAQKLRYFGAWSLNFYKYINFISSEYLKACRLNQIKCRVSGFKLSAFLLQSAGIKTNRNIWLGWVGAAGWVVERSDGVLFSIPQWHVGLMPLKMGKRLWNEWQCVRVRVRQH